MNNNEGNNIVNTESGRPDTEFIQNADGRSGASGTAENGAGFKKILAIAIAAVGAVLIFLSVWSALTVHIGTETFKQSEKELDLRNAGITTTEDIYRIKNPEYIDLRGNNIPTEEIIELIDSYPDCKVVWSVPMGGQLIDSTAKTLSATGISADEAGLLRYFTELEKIDAMGADYEVLEVLMQMPLDCEIEWDVAIGDQRYLPDTTSIVIGDISDEEVRRLAMLTNLETVDARGCTAYDALMYVSQQLPECSVLWTVDIYGFTLDNTAQSLNFNRKKVDDIERLDADFEKLKYLPALKNIDMCGCGVANEQMAEWRDKYPECKFVWEISFGNAIKSWTVRTDIEAFSSLLSVGTLNLGDQEFYKDLFLYCTDLKALDLGHNKITDISMITNLKKLQAVVLMDNPISDFTPLTELPELRFAEINKTDITDLSFAKECKKLEHLDISFSDISDLSPLHECESLKYCVFYDTDLEEENVRAFEAAKPDCVISWHGGYQYQILRCTPLRSGYRYVLKNFEYLESFTDWETFSFVENAKLEEPTGHRSPEYYASGRYDRAVARFKALGEY